MRQFRILTEEDLQVQNNKFQSVVFIYTIISYNCPSWELRNNWNNQRWCFRDTFAGLWLWRCVGVHSTIIVYFTDVCYFQVDYNVTESRDRDDLMRAILLSRQEANNEEEKMQKDQEQVKIICFYSVMFGIYTKVHHRVVHALYCSPSGRQNKRFISWKW